MRLQVLSMQTVTYGLRKSVAHIPDLVEMQVESIDVIGWVDDPRTYPIPPQRVKLETLREVGGGLLQLHETTDVNRGEHPLGGADRRSCG